MKEQAAKFKEMYPDQAAFDKEVENIKKLNTEISDAKEKGLDTKDLQNKMDNQNRLMRGAEQSQKVFTKVMTAVDPDKLQSIALAILSGCMTCLVTLKNEMLSLLTQSMDCANQVAEYAKA